VVTAENQIVIAAEVNVDSPDFGHLEPMFDAAERELASAGVAEKPGVAIADAGYWHQAQMQRIVNRGTQVLIPPDSIKRSRPSRDGAAASTSTCAASYEPSTAASSTNDARR
jgi:hypothetical protein